MVHPSSSNERVFFHAVCSEGQPVQAVGKSFMTVFEFYLVKVVISLYFCAQPNEIDNYKDSKRKTRLPFAQQQHLLLVFKKLTP